MQGLLNGLLDRLHRQPERRPDPRGRRRAEVGDVVDPVFVEADRAHQVDEQAPPRAGPDDIRPLDQIGGKRRSGGDAERIGEKCQT